MIKQLGNEYCRDVTRDCKGNKCSNNGTFVLLYLKGFANCIKLIPLTETAGVPLVSPLCLCYRFKSVFHF